MTPQQQTPRPGLSEAGRLAFQNHPLLACLPAYRHGRL